MTQPTESKPAPRTGRSAAALGTGVAIVGVAFVGAAGLFWRLRDPPRAPPAATSSVPALPSATSAAREDGEAPLGANASTIVTLTDARPLRDATFVPAEAGRGFRAEGVDLSQDGSLRFTSQASGAELRQEFVRAELRTPGASAPRSLPRADAAEGSPSSEEGRASLRWRRIVEGIDLEYRYDGRDVEELFHIEPSLQHSLRERGEALSLVSRFPGVTPQQGALLADARSGAPMLPGQGTTRPGAIVSTEDVELMVGSQRYVLPRAVAIDARGERVALRREFRFLGEGLEVAVDVPASVLAATLAPLVIDPSIVDSGRNISARDGTARNVVQDEQGHMHVVYAATDATGTSRAYYTMSRDQGVSWESPRPLADLPTGTTRQYVPELRIDSRGTLHALWFDIGTNGGARGGTGTGHRTFYARCPNRCRLRVWSSGNQVGGRLLAASTYAHSRVGSVVVDQDDGLHVLLKESNTAGTDHKLRYFQIIDDNFIEGTPPGFYEPDGESAAVLTVDGNNRLHYFTGFHDQSGGVRAYARNADTGAWSTVGADLNVYRTGCLKSWYYAFEAVVDASHQTHLLGHAQGWACNDNVDRVPAKSFILYAKFDPALGLSDGYVMAQAEPGENVHWPTITVDAAGRLHAFWNKTVGEGSSLMYARRAADQGAFESPIVFLPPASTPGPANARARAAFPLVSGGATPLNEPAAGSVEVLVATGGQSLSFASTGRPLGGPRPLTPLDHRFLNLKRPTFSWMRIPGDNLSNTQYRLQVATTPLFSPASTLVINQDTGTQATFTPSTDLPDGYYYWRVSATNPFGQGPYGDIFELPIDSTPPSAFSLQAPANNATVNESQPEFRWSAATDNGP